MKRLADESSLNWDMEDSVSTVKRAGTLSARSGNEKEDWLNISGEENKKAPSAKALFLSGHAAHSMLNESLL